MDIPTFFCAVGTKGRIEQLENATTELESFESKEYKRHSINQTFDILTFGKQNQLDGPGKSNHFFQGMMVDHQSKSIILETDGFSSWKEKYESRDYSQYEGGFLSIEWSSQTVEIQHDCFGLYPVFYYQNNDIFIASDSLFVISRTMKMLGFDVSLNKKSILTRSWTHGLACSLMTKETMITGVTYLLPCSRLRIYTDKNSIQMREYNLDVKKIFHRPNKPYLHALMAAKSEILSVVHSLSKGTKLGYKLGLSGGLDSRIILALILQTEKLKEKTYINSNTHISRLGDYEIVKSLSDEFNFEFNGEIPPTENQPVRVNNPFGNYIMFNLGTFDMTYLYRSYWEKPNLIEIGGHGAEIAKGTFAGTKLVRKIPIWRPFLRIKLFFELKKSLHYHSIKMNRENTIQWHHMLYKSAIQNGRYLERTQISLRPLMNRRLAAIGLHNKKNHKEILKDLLILLSPKLASHPFDKENKNIHQSYIDLVQQEIENIERESIQEYQIYGDQENIKNGLLNSFNSLTTKYTLQYADKKNSLLKLMEQVWDNLQDKEVKNAYLGAYRLAKRRLNDENSYLPSAGTPASKIIALGVLFE